MDTVILQISIWASGKTGQTTTHYELLLNIVSKMNFNSRIKVLNRQELNSEDIVNFGLSTVVLRACKTIDYYQKRIIVHQSCTNSQWSSMVNFDEKIPVPSNDTETENERAGT